MVELRFNDFVTEICAYYERKKPADKTLDLWFDRVRAIPDEALEYIRDAIFKENDSKPANLPSTMWALYMVWLDNHPEKKAPRIAYDCPDCEDGWLALEKDDPRYKTPLSYSAACGKCKQISSKHYMTLTRALELGYRRKNLVTDHGKGIHSVKQLVDGIGQKMIH